MCGSGAPNGGATPGGGRDGGMGGAPPHARIGRAIGGGGRPGPMAMPGGGLGGGDKPEGGAGNMGKPGAVPPGGS